MYQRISMGQIDSMVFLNVSILIRVSERERRVILFGALGRKPRTEGLPVFYPAPHLGL